MRSLNDLPIGKKLGTLLLLFILGLTAYIGFVFQTALAVRGNSEQARHAFPLLLQVGDISRLTTEMRDLYTVAVTSQDADMLDNARREAHRVQAQTEQLMADGALNGVRLAGLATAFTRYAQAADAWAGAVVEGGGTPGQAQVRLYELSQRQHDFNAELERSREAINASFTTRLHAIEGDADATWQVGLFGGIALSLVLLALNASISRRMIVRPLQGALAAMRRIADGHWDEPVPAGSRDEVGELLGSLETLRRQLKTRHEADREAEFVARLLADLNLQMRGDLDEVELCGRVIRFLTPGLGCEIGLIYVNRGELLHPAAAYALHLEDIAPVRHGHSLIGQVARSGQPTLLRELPADYARTIASGSTTLVPRHLAILPVHHDDELLAVLELGALAPFDDDFLELIARCSEHFAVVLKVAQTRRRHADALAALPMSA